MLQLENVSKQFAGVTAVDQVALDLASGSMTGIIGRSGAGKSTLLRLINRLIEPSGGRIRFGEIEVTGLQGGSLRAWQSRCAMIFQQFNLVPRLDVLTNVLIGRLHSRPTLPSLMKHFTRPERALAVHALERLDLLPHAFQRAETLSGGQQQRVAIARALVQEPSLLLADEPIASLDPHSARAVMDAIRTINREDGITVICNLHHLETARAYCDRIIGMRSGRVVFDGPPARLTASMAAEVYGGGLDSEEMRDALSPSAHLPASSAAPLVTPGLIGEMA
jgi:phosphonate transport system ATP-binding protein